VAPYLTCFSLVANPEMISRWPVDTDERPPHHGSRSETWQPSCEGPKARESVGSVSLFLEKYVELVKAFTEGKIKVFREVAVLLTSPAE
jgi:hypothetical protein